MIKEWEIQVLDTLQWELSACTAHSFLEHFLNRDCLQHCDKNVRRQAENIAAVAATEYKFITTKQSVIAAAALALAVQHAEEDPAEDIIKQLTNLIKVSSSDFLLVLSHISDLSSQVTKLNLPEFDTAAAEYFTESKTPDLLHSSESLSLTPTDSFRVLEVLAA